MSHKLLFKSRIHVGESPHVVLFNPQIFRSILLLLGGSNILVKNHHAYLLGGLEHLDYFSISWECHHPN